jgi:dihydrofolate reductase/thymidylate synthase
MSRIYLSRNVNKPFHLIAAMDETRGIGKDGTIPWKCPEDMKYFRDVTKSAPSHTQNAVIMGRKTWESLPKALPGRVNVVITSTPDRITNEGVHVFRSLLEAHSYLNERGDIFKQFVIGGAQLYKDTLLRNWSSVLHLTTIQGNHNCDTFFPPLENYWKLCGAEQLSVGVGVGGCGVEIYHNRYTRHLEEQYIYRMRELSLQEPIIGRNGSVHSKFQWSWSTDLSDGLPLFSTRRSYWKGICKELLFFIAGKTNSKLLEADGIRIWQGNTSSEFLESRELPYQEGDMGPMYGWVWRHYGATYRGMDADYSGQGFDQLKDVCDKLLNDPHNRRIMLTTYDPSAVKMSVLAPCHGIISQFYVRSGPASESGYRYRYLDMYTYQRSADMFLGVNFNIPSHAILQMIIARATGLTPGKLYYGFGDNHVYANHLEPLSELLERTPNDTFPELTLPPPPHADDASGTLAWIENLKYEDLVLKDYHPQKGIKAEMSA